MKLIEIKQYVFNSLQVKDTKQLKIERTDLVKGLDLRTKVAWQKIELLVTQEIDLSFHQILFQMEQENQKSNNIIQNALTDWGNFKSKVIAESEAEDEGKLSHLSDYRMPEQFSEKAKKIKKSKNSNLVNFQK
jgi:hypothetical protein